MVKSIWNPDVSSLGNVPECRDCAEDCAALRCVGVSCSQSNFDFAYCPDAMQKTDSEMSEEGDECKPEQPSIPLQLNVVLRNATTIRQVQCISNEQAFDKVAAGIPGLTNPMHVSIGIWEKIVARREPDDPRSMHNPTGMRFAIMGNKTDMIKYNMTNHVSGDVTSYKVIMDAAFMAPEEEASDKAALKAAFKAAEEEVPDKAALIASQNTSSGAPGSGFCHH